MNIRRTGNLGTAENRVKKMSSIFLCHSSLDKPWVQGLADRLRSDGVRVWIDESELKIGDSLVKNIASGISETQYFAVIISANSVRSNWVQKELSLAMTKEVLSGEVVVLPIVIEPCLLPSFLTDKLYADFTKFDSFEHEYARILRVLKRDEKLLPAKAAGTTQRFFIENIKAQPEQWVLRGSLRKVLRYLQLNFFLIPLP